MPLLKKKAFMPNPIPDGLKDDDEVFYCKQTKEVFKSYEEYFDRAMLTNSVIWQCSLTGRSDLTYSEAVDSEKTAKKLLRQFPSALRSPIILVTSQTKRASLKKLVDDVFNFVKDRFFKDEKVDVMNESGRGCRFCRITDILKPENLDATKFYEPAEIKYQVEAIDDEKEPKVWTVKATSLRRDKTTFTKEKTKLFLKQHVAFVEGANSMLIVREDSFQKYVTDRGVTMENITVGKVPEFETSKRAPPQSKGRKPGGKQGDITKYLDNSGSSTKPLTSEEKKLREENSKKFREEMEAKRKEKADLEAEKHKKVAEERARVVAKIQATVRDYNQIRDDLELTDQRSMPKSVAISTLIDQKYFADFIKVLEFLHSFPELVQHKFPYGVTIETLERALILKEVNGPLSEILQVLLVAIFNFQNEEENECEIEYRATYDVPLKHSKLDQMKNASKVHMWAAKHFNTKISDMVMDSTTLSELLRLHIMGSGAIVSEKTSKHRFAIRGGYKSQDDPGLVFTSKYPHIIKFLSQFTVFQLPTKDILRILTCLIDQALTYSNLREVLEDRLEQSASAKLEYKNMKINEGRRERKIIEEKKLLQEELNTLIASYAEETEAKRNALTKKAEEELEHKIQKIDTHSAKDKNQHLKDLKAQVSIYFNHQTYLGSDRAFRNYYIFESLPGLFVEHDITYSGRCSEKPVKNNPALAHGTKEQRYGIIKQMVQTEEAGGSDDKENKVDINGAAQDKSAASLKKEADVDLQKELFMCNCDPATCIVHSDTPERNSWTYFHTAQDVDALIESLNTRGYREKALRDQLEASRELIIDYIKDCPVSKLSVEMTEEEKVYEIKKISRRMTKKYDNANLNCQSGTDPNYSIDLSLRLTILEFEQKLALGSLGKIKVQDRILWRKYIEDLEYYALDDDLKWGSSSKILNGHAKENGKEEGSEVTDETEDTASSVGNLEQAHTFDSGNCSDLDYEEEEEAKMKTSQMEDVKLKVKNLAMALLQIEQGIDIKFIGPPFGPAKEIKDKNQLAKAMERCRARIMKWEESLMKSTSYSMVFLHYNILHDSILWSRSAQRVGCMICRRKNDPEQTLLCDECNKGWHMFCLKPQVTKIPEGDWFCPRCKPDDFISKTARKRRQDFVESEDEEEELTADDSTAESFSESDEDTCMVCQSDGELVNCTFCEFKCHPKCAKPPVKKTKMSNWKCWKCTSVQQRSERIKRRRLDKDDDDESEKSESEEEPPVKIKKVETSRRSKRAYEESDEDSEDEVLTKKHDDGRRTSRRVSKPSRKNSPELEEDDDEDQKPSRRSTKKSLDAQSGTDRRASKRSFDPFNAISLSSLIDEIIKQKNAWPFTKPVSVNEVPDYLDVIKKPMDFGKIKSKLNLGDYRTNEQVMKDIELVFFNCDLYNIADSEIYDAGAKLEKFVAKRSKELNLPFQPSDMISN